MRPVSNTEKRPAEPVHAGSDLLERSIEVLTSREVPLGGPRAMTVRRTLPQRARTPVGAWCFADHYGPDDVALTGGMRVAPHPHTGLQTVSWLFSGEIEHRDSLGNQALVRPGELNLMTGGFGICHSEVSTQRTTSLHGVQLRIALPEAHRHTARDFRHHVPGVVPLDGGEARVFLGSLAGDTSPVRRWQRDGTWARILTQLQAEADAKGLITWEVDVDSTVCRAHQHAAGAAKRGTCRRNHPAGSSSSRPTTASDAPAVD
ncbi:hypothetical protein SAMN05444921_1092 [Streptomyces wuyuanensis]|uniref:Pirin N-terminal domain-containing protein n=1 Tax=Streptomyces wuyuanensis TaxID=1196353 RepID=A0A1G9TN16_9ACTN|nr:hypothetical protein SAMN05444921_1092 [Streptomyces wuyuanensis]